MATNRTTAWNRLLNSQKGVAYLFIAPSLLIISFFVIIPMI